MNLLKNVRLIVFLIFLALAAYLIFSPIVLQKSGVFVSYVDEKSSCGSIKLGDVITQVGSSSVKNSDEFDKITKDFKVGDYASMIVNNGPGGCVAMADGSFGIKVSGFESKSLTLSADIGGSNALVLTPSKILDDSMMKTSKEIIDNRINILKMQDAYISITGDKLILKTIERKSIPYLTMEGKFNVKIVENLKLKDGSTKLKIGDNDYDIKLVGDKKISLNESMYTENQKFSLENINFEIKNITNSTVSLDIDFLTNDDVVKVLRTDSSKQEVGYRFDIIFEVTNKSSENFAKITKRIGTVLVGQTAVLDARLVYYLDDKKLENTNTDIEFKIAGKPFEKNAFYIIAVRETIDEMNDLKTKTEIALRSGNLPAKFEFTSTEQSEGSLKNVVMYGFLVLFALIALLEVISSYILYKNEKIGLLNVGLSAALVFVVVGIAALTRVLLGTGWMIDIYSIAGLVCLAIFASLQMLLISEAIIKSKRFDIFYRNRKIISTPTFINITLIIFSFALLFTAWKGFGLAIIIGACFEFGFVVPLFKNFVEGVGKSF